MFMELYKFSKLVMRLNSCSMDLGHDSELVNERSISESIDHSRLVDIRMNKTSNLKRKILLGQIRGCYVPIYFS